MKRRTIDGIEYPYNKSPSDQYELYHCGRFIFKGTEQAIWEFFHREHAYSVHHALKFEGYLVIPFEEAEAARVENRILYGKEAEVRPTLQNLPVHTPRGQELRGALLSDLELPFTDYAGLERRVLKKMRKPDD